MNRITFAITTDIPVWFDSNLGDSNFEVTCKGLYTLREPGYSALFNFPGYYLTIAPTNILLYWLIIQ